MKRTTDETEVRGTRLVDNVLDPERPALDTEEEMIVEKWHEVVKAIQETTKEYSAASPSFDPSSPSDFQTYWRTVFSLLRQSVSADPGIPRHLTAPPVSKFTITLFDAIHGLNCPCCHPDVEPNIVLDNSDGVTKEDLMDGFVNYMYSAVLPRVYIEPMPLPDDEDGETEATVENQGEDTEAPADDEDDAVEFRDNAGTLVYSASWMSGCGVKGDETEAYSSEPNIVFYCCLQAEYPKKREIEEARERKRESFRKRKAAEEERERERELFRRRNV
ncbi:uncharacterized protein DNG_04380 [Cephalotrichum gorgonifer]|uniref:Uncharacterized protein n=1 Tax=Cephalotrichum gorgonifer TaxID=2041049 RepID=A0AAE8MYR9_9PEZI|nr:uncharacterized protein DNG_04380 [Cephalotrichum gorgonifer]